MIPADPAVRSQRPRGARWKPWLPVSLALASFCIFLAVAAGRRIGTYSVETDFYGDYAPDAARLRAGEIPQNGYQGPGYPAILALVEGAVGEPFRAGRLISVASAATVGILAFALFRRLFGYWTGVGSQLLVLVSGIFPRLAVTASTDMLFLMLCLRRWLRSLAPSCLPHGESVSQVF